MRTSRAATAPPKLRGLTFRENKNPNPNLDWRAWGDERSPSYDVGFFDSEKEVEEGQEEKVEVQEQEENSLLDRLEEEVDRCLSLSRRDQSDIELEVDRQPKMAKHVKVEPNVERKVKRERSIDPTEKKALSLEIQEKIRLWKEKHLRKPTKTEVKRIEKRIKREWDERKLFEEQGKEVVSLDEIPEGIVENREGTMDKSVSMDLDSASESGGGHEMGGHEKQYSERNKELVEAAIPNGLVSQADGGVKQDVEEEEEEDLYGASPVQNRKVSQAIVDQAGESQMGEQSGVVEPVGGEEVPRKKTKGERKRERESQAEAAKLAASNAFTQAWGSTSVPVIRPDQSQGGIMAVSATQAPPQLTRQKTKSEKKLERQRQAANLPATNSNSALNVAPKKSKAQRTRERREAEEEAARLAAGNASTQVLGSGSAVSIQSNHGQGANQAVIAAQDAPRKKTKRERKRERVEAARLADGQVSLLVIGHATHAENGLAVSSILNARDLAVERKKTRREKGNERQELAALALSLQSAVHEGPSSLFHSALPLLDEQNAQSGQVQEVEGPIILEQRVNDRRFGHEEAQPELQPQVEEDHSVRLPSDPMEVDAVNGIPVGWSDKMDVVEVSTLTHPRTNHNKRKRAASNTDSLPLRNSGIDEPAEAEDVSEHCAKKHKKHKKHHQDQESNLVEENEDDAVDHRVRVNLAKERRGKTISKKRRRKEEQQSKPSKQPFEASDHEDDASSQGDDEDSLPWDERILHPNQCNTHSTQGSTVRPHDLPRYVGKQEALIRTITHPHPPTPSKIIPSFQKSQALSPATPVHSSSDESEDTGTAHEPAIDISHPVRESPIKPPVTFAARQRTTSMSSSPMNASTQASRLQHNVSSSPIKVKGKAKEKIVRKHAEVADSLESVVKDIQKVVTNIGSLFSEMPVQSSPAAAAHIVKSIGESSQKEKKGQGDNGEKGNLLNNWESKGGRIQAYVAGEEEGTEVKENIAFSSAYIKKKRSVSISNATVSTINIEIGKNIVISTNDEDEDAWRLKVCTVAEGRVRVDLGGDEEDEIEGTVFEISKGGMWRIRVGERCEVRALGEDDEGENDEAVVFVVGVE